MLESENLLRKAERKLDVARKLLELGEHEDAVSRAYYSIFHAAKAVLVLEGVSSRTHEGTIKDFGKFIKECMHARYFQMQEVSEKQQTTP